MSDYTFLFPCFRRLQKVGGELDALVQIAELGVRRLEKDLVQENDKRAAIAAFAMAEGINVRHYNQKLLRPHLSRLYILSAYQNTERFMKELLNEHPSGAEWKQSTSRRQGETRFEWIIRCAGKSPRRVDECIGAYELQLFEYFRYVRNAILHIVDPNEEVLPQLRKLQRIVAKLDEPRPPLPNDYNSISFEDFILFSAGIHRLAGRLCMLLRPTDEQIADVFIRYATNNSHGFSMQTLERLQTRPHGLTRLVRRLFHLDPADASRIAELAREQLSK